MVGFHTHGGVGLGLIKVGLGLIKVGLGLIKVGLGLIKVGLGLIKVGLGLITGCLDLVAERDESAVGQLDFFKKGADLLFRSLVKHSLENFVGLKSILDRSHIFQVLNVSRRLRLFMVDVRVHGSITSADYGAAYLVDVGAGLDVMFTVLLEVVDGALAVGVEKNRAWVAGAAFCLVPDLDRPAPDTDRRGSRGAIAA